MEKTGERGGLREAEVFCALAEVGFGRRFHAVDAVTEVHGVQVGGEDLVFGVLAPVGKGERGLDEASAKEVSKRSSSAT